jgi:hypothetical protein
MSNNGIYQFNPSTLSSLQLVPLSSKNDSLDLKFLNFNIDHNSLLFMLEGYVYRTSLNSKLTKEVLNLNNQSNTKIVDIKGNGQSYFLMENYDGRLEVFNIKNSKTATICENSCTNPVWFY